MAKTLSGHWKRLIGGCAALLALAFAAPSLLRPPELEENRSLAIAPAWPHDAASLAAWPKAADAYVADHFPARALLIGALNFLRLRIAASGSDRVVVGRDGWLFYDNGSHLGAARGAPAMSAAAARSWLEGLAGRTEALRRSGIAYVVLIAPDKEVIEPEHGPAWFRLDPARTAVRLQGLAAQSGAGDIVYPAPEIAAAARAGEAVYSPFETHWTGLGAYEGYAALMRRLQALGLTDGPRPLDAFALANHARSRTPRNLALMLGVASFVPIHHPEVGDPDMETKVATIYLTDKIDWTQPYVIDTGLLGKPVLLMTRDSFSTALTPFLYRHFSRIILAHNQDGTWRQDLIDRFKPDVVVLEIVESGLPFVMQPAPPAAPETTAKIAEAVARPRPAASASPPALPTRRGPRPPLQPVAGLVARVLYGGSDNDRLEGGPGEDAIYGRGGDDTILGGAGDDTLRGGKGDDVIDGGPGDDDIWGDLGNDTLTGGPGADRFHVMEGGGTDVITDYSAAEGDRIVVEPGLAYTVTQEGADTVIHLRGSKVILKGVRAASLPRGWILHRGGL